MILFVDEKVDNIKGSELLAEMMQHHEKWETFLSYRHAVNDHNDFNKLKRLIVMIEITKHYDEIQKYPHILEIFIYLLVFFILLFYFSFLLINVVDYKQI